MRSSPLGQSLIPPPKQSPHAHTKDHTFDSGRAARSNEENGSRITPRVRADACLGPEGMSVIKAHIAGGGSPLVKTPLPYPAAL